jgi:hypothetical protein
VPKLAPHDLRRILEVINVSTSAVENRDPSFARRRSDDQCKRSSLLYAIENGRDTLAGVANVFDSAKVASTPHFDTLSECHASF